MEELQKKAVLAQVKAHAAQLMAGYGDEAPKMSVSLKWGK